MRDLRSHISHLISNPYFYIPMLDKLNTKYALIVSLLILVEVMLIYSFNYVPSFKDSRPILSIEDQNQLNYKKYQQFLKDQVQYKVEHPPLVKKALSALEQELIDSGLVNVQTLDPDIWVALRYSCKDNFMKMDLYGDLDNCYLQKDVAEKLALASKILHEKYGYYNLLVFDGVRPMSIQSRMWDSLKIPSEEKMKYLSPPSYGSLHNYGAAVDVSLVNYEGWEVDMGTPFDFFGELGHPSAENRMISEGKLTHRQQENRKLLREVMYKAGFTGLGTEWWHFNSCGIAEAKSKYHIVK
jgi:D-alanyl-D-alanine dipeptidase